MPTYSTSAQQIISAFAEVPKSSRLELLLEYANALPALPDRYADHPELLERVEECQSPVFLFVEVFDSKVRIFLTAPLESPTTRGFASLLQLALDGGEIDDVAGFSDQFINELQLTELVSPLRIRGMHGMLARIKRQVAEKTL
ncbi:MAG: SufE family protein [Rhodoluna sp.]|nr:SufE family protein [Rhodoluna sp.]